MAKDYIKQFLNKKNITYSEEHPWRLPLSKKQAAIELEKRKRRKLFGVKEDEESQKSHA